MVQDVTNFPLWVLPTIRIIQERFAALGSVEPLKTPETTGTWGKRSKAARLNARSEEIDTTDVPA